MSFLNNILKKANDVVNSYAGDKTFLSGVAAAAANVTAADGSIDDNEIDAAITGMKANKILGGSYSPPQIEEALQHALNNAKTRLGRMENKRAIEALVTRPADAKQDVFLIAADVADQGDIGDKEMVVLEDIAKILGLDAKKLLG